MVRETRRMRSCARADRAQIAHRRPQQLLALGVQHAVAAQLPRAHSAVEDGVVNSLKHGNGGDPSKKVRVRYHIGADAVLAEVEDEGPGFDPATVPDPTDPQNWDRPCGRGLLRMRHYTTWLRYHGRGNRLTLCKRRPTHQCDPGVTRLFGAARPPVCASRCKNRIP
jgi:anti-sigma regulatory factor (Ser/Thr protein kinase)